MSPLTSPVIRFSCSVLSASANQISKLPASFQTLALDHIDVSGNPFETEDVRPGHVVPRELINRASSLLSLAAKATIKFKYGSKRIFFVYFRLADGPLNKRTCWTPRASQSYIRHPLIKNFPLHQLLPISDVTNVHKSLENGSLKKIENVLQGK